MAQFFINRPIFAWVIAIGIMLGGLLAVFTLPIAQYPQIAPTSVRLSATYTGADAQTIENSVTKVIEQGMTGIDHLDYMTSSSSSSGTVSITLTFTNAADPDIAQMQVQNKLQLVTAQLPSVVQSTGISVSKASDSFFMVIAFVSRDGSLSDVDISDWVNSTLNDTIKRLDGVGSTQLLGSGYAMRVWVDPDKLAQFSLMPTDVSAAIEAQNVEIAAGQLGGRPALQGQQLNAAVRARSRMQTPEQFRNIILKSAADGSIVRIGDVATVELGADNYRSSSRYNGKPAAALAIMLANGANAIGTADRVKNAIADSAATMPEGVEVHYPYETTPFVRLSIEEVVKTLAEAIVLVFLVMLIFLQNLRATLIPTLAVPVVLLGTFGVLSIAGYSINMLTMFAMVLAIGLLVDDAIVVVENVERVMEEDGLPPKEATQKSMREITGALVGIATVLSAVFVPMAFFGGSVGVIYRQFSVTIVSAMILSVIVAMVLTPALCATILRPRREHSGTRGLAGWFNRNFDRTTEGYRRSAGGVVGRPRWFLAGFVIVVLAAAALFTRLPSSFLPDEDQGILMTMAQLPVGATQDRTDRVLADVTRYYLDQEKEAVDGILTVSGFSFAGEGQNTGMAFVKLKPFDERKSPALAAQAIVGRAMGTFARISDAMVFALTPPTVPGLGNSSGFDVYLQDVGGAGHETLMEMRNRVLGAASQSRKLMATRPNGQDDTPQFTVDVDQEKASAFSLSLANVDDTLATAWGGTYVNDFIHRGRVKYVYVQSDAKHRMTPENLESWYVRNTSGSMVPFSAFTSTRWTFGSPKLERFNGASAVEIVGQGAPGVSSGDAMNEIAGIIESLPTGFRPGWAGLSRQEKLAGSQAAALYVISLLVVFLALAALYESWSTPIAVLLSVPVGILGAVVAATLTGQTNDVYFKVGLLTTIGLSAKNAILIVEFALARLKAGEDLASAALDAARQRFRPILMTSLAFILGVVPLATATGAGSGSQNAIGIGVLGGMIAATVLGVFFIPLLFVTVRRVTGWFAARRAARPTQTAASTDPA
ncbi:efflux RND transporter permease subunit [Rhodoplanes sp. TEM]|uniref:Efflux pump membrane transporter n=1 Tax=Rhodoplanes tepidamans TaxID=200616 RepID=A0ABT5J6J7_RHOTP|nr:MULTISPECIES: efflux RND transporter permease subunit [Rhodoplanes]MDC7785266.1 efflux RND transporter permease subunit [Rhodoplanes tepidamans]MDC7984667.1 efflux RND transporter permease subunit [Rhodoplanes sp. TEM]MDQ0353524.1 multidrug efflux pump [Rhodoplanes tepidamans]